MIICVDLGATEIKVAPVDDKNGVCAVSNVCKIPTCADCGKEGILSALKQAIAQFVSVDATGISIATAGDVDQKRGVITYATENLPGMTGFDFVAFCTENFHLPVRVINDALGALLGEMKYGAGQHLTGNVAMLTLGSGVGGGYFANGKIVADQTNDFARFGHICLEENGRLCTCGKRGCVEMYLSGRAIHKDASQLGIDSAGLFDLYLQGEPRNVQFVNTFRQNLKKTLDKVYATCPFDVCILGGGVSDWMSQAFGAVTENLGYNVVRAQLGNSAGIYGAYANYFASEDLT